MTALLTLASAIPFLNGEKEGDEVFGPFNPEAEILNGEEHNQVAMVLLCVSVAGSSGVQWHVLKLATCFSKPRTVLTFFAEASKSHPPSFG